MTTPRYRDRKIEDSVDAMNESMEKRLEDAQELLGEDPFYEEAEELPRDIFWGKGKDNVEIHKG